MTGWRDLYHDLSVRSLVLALTAGAALAVVLVPAGVLLALGVLAWPVFGVVVIVLPLVLYRGAVRWFERGP